MDDESTNARDRETVSQLGNHDAQEEAKKARRFLAALLALVFMFSGGCIAFLYGIEWFFDLGNAVPLDTRSFFASLGGCGLAILGYALAARIPAGRKRHGPGRSP